MTFQEVKPAAAQVIQHRDLVSGAHEAIDEIGTDKAGASSDNDIHKASQFASDFAARNRQWAGVIESSEESDLGFLTQSETGRGRGGSYSAMALRFLDKKDPTKRRGAN